MIICFFIIAKTRDRQTDDRERKKERKKERKRERKRENCALKHS